MTKRDIARKFRTKYGKEMPTLKLARIMFGKNKLVFKNVEDARDVLRSIEGKKNHTRELKSVRESEFFMAEDRPKNPYSLPEEYGEEPPPYKLPKSCNRILLISDIHIPYHDIDAITIALDYGKSKDVNCIFINGDLIDNHKVSKYEADLSKRSPKQEFDATKQFLVSLRAAFPKAMIYWLKGNHCYIDGTEVLTDRGFVKFSDLMETDLVAEFDKDKNIQYSKPISLSSRVYDGEMYDIDSGFSRQIVTDRHHVIVGDQKIEARLVKESDLMHMPVTGMLNLPDYDISDDMLRLLVNVVCDGTIVLDPKYGERKMRIQFKLSKQRKIDHLSEVLDSLGFQYSHRVCKPSGINVLQPYYIRFYGDMARMIYDLLGGKKQFPEFFRKLSARQAKIVISEISLTDGHVKDGGVFWTTTSKHDADLVIEMAALNGLFASAYDKNIAKSSGFANGKQQYLVKLRYERSTNTPKRIDKFDYSGIVHCLEMPLGTVITRFAGRIAFSGNCVRWEKFLAQKASEIWDDPYFHLEQRLALNEEKIILLNDNLLVKAGKLSITHGHHIFKGIFSPVSPARGAYMKAKQSIIVGHLHRASQHVETNLDGDVVTAWSLGCLCKRKQSYSPIVSNSIHGFAYVEVAPNGDYSVFNHQIIKGKVF